MTTVHRALVLADTAVAAQRAVRWTTGDASIRVGSDIDEGVLREEERFETVVVAGGHADADWIRLAFSDAAGVLVAGGRVTLVLDDQEGSNGVPAVHDLPDEVAAAWRLIAFSVEHPFTAVSFSRAADTDGDVPTRDVFRHAQLVAILYRRPALLEEFDQSRFQDSASSTLRPEGAEADDEVLRLRRDLAAYRHSKLGRLTTKYWELRRRIRRRD